MLLHLKPEISYNEFQTIKSSLEYGVRSDLRKPNESRNLICNTSTEPGFARITLGNTVVTANTSARLVVPSPDSPTRGIHLITIVTTHYQSQIQDFQTYFRYLWHKCQVIEEGSLCIRPGEKVWKLMTNVTITNDDGGLLDACFSAVYTSLNTLRFPAFHSTTGVLLSPSSHRTHRIALTFNPVPVSVCFFNTAQIPFAPSPSLNKAFNATMPRDASSNAAPQTRAIPDPSSIVPSQAKKPRLPQPNSDENDRIPVIEKIDMIIDPTLAELQVATGYGFFLYDEYGKVVLLDTSLPGNILEAKRQACVIANERRIAMKKVVDAYDCGINCVGDRADFIEYETAKISNPAAGKELKPVEDMAVWKGDTCSGLELSGFNVKDDAVNRQETVKQHFDEANWLLSSVIV